MEAHGQQMKAVYTVVEKSTGKSYWLRLGVGFVNRDGSLTLKLDALPVNGMLQVREWESREDAARKASEQVPGREDAADTRPRRDEPPGARRAPDMGGRLA